VSLANPLESKASLLDVHIKVPAMGSGSHETCMKVLWKIEVPIHRAVDKLDP